MFRHRDETLECDPCVGGSFCRATEPFESELIKKSGNIRNSRLGIENALIGSFTLKIAEFYGKSVYIRVCGKLGEAYWIYLTDTTPMNKLT